MSKRTVPGSEPDTLAAFEGEARRIIKVSGGLNARSLVKIRRKGRGHGLSDEQIDAVIAQVRSKRTPEPVASPDVEAFRRRVGSILNKAKFHKGRLLNPSHIELLESIGRERHGLDPEQAAEVVRAVVRERGLKRLSTEAAEAAFRQQVEATRAISPITPNKRKRLLAFADTLGIAPPRAMALLNEGAATALAHPAEVRKANGRFLAMVIGLGVGTVLIFLVAMSFVRMTPRKPAPKKPTSAPAAVASRPAATITTPAEGPERAWQEALQQAGTVFRTPADEAILQGLASADEDRRLGAFRSLLLRLSSHLQNASERDAMAGLIAAGYAAEPSEKVAALIREQLGSLLSEPLGAEVRGAGPFDRAYWALESALRALRGPGLEADRIEGLVAVFTKLLGMEGRAAMDVASGSDGEADAATATVRERVGTRYYQNLIDHASLQAALSGFAEAHEALRRHVEKDLPAEDRARLDADFLALALESAGSEWPDYLGRIADCLDSGEPRAVEPILELYRKTANTELRDQLDFELRHRLGGGVNLDNPEAVIEAFRKRGRPARGHREQFREKAEAALAASAGPAEGPGTVLRQIVALAEASSLGCALDQGEAAESEFDAILQGPKDAEPGPSPATPNAAGPAGFAGGPLNRPATFGAAVPPDVETWIRQIARGRPFERMSAWQSLGRLGLPEDLPPEQAKIIAEYILWGGKSEEEAAITRPALNILTRPRAVRLAMADLLGEVRPLPRRFNLISAPVAERTLASVLGRSITLSPRNRREQAQRLLLTDVLDTMEPDIDADVARYRELYQAQGRLLGMGEADSLLTARPSQMIEVVANQLADQLGQERATLGGPERALLARVPHEIVAADYLAEDEIQRAVLMQRVWLDLLAIYVTSKQPARADAVREVVEEGPAEPRDVLNQLRSGERKILRLWMLQNEIDPR